MIYILALSISVCLICGQALWGSAIKALSGGNNPLGGIELILKLATTGKFWLGATFYAIGTIAYFLLLSKAKFFSVQITMTALAIIFSALLSHFFFKELLTPTNILGMIIILSGIFLVTH